MRAEVESTYWFPDNPTLEFTPGKPAPCIIGLRNTGPDAINASVGNAHLAFAHEPSTILYNFTMGFFFNKVIPPGGETTVEYDIFFPHKLPPREFLLTVNAVLNDNDKEAVSVLVLNENINVVEPNKLIDFELLSLYLILAGILGFAAWSAYEFAMNKGWIKKSKKKVVVTKSKPSDKAEWLKGTYADVKGAKKQG